MDAKAAVDPQVVNLRPYSYKLHTAVEHAAVLNGLGRGRYGKLCWSIRQATFLDLRAAKIELATPLLSAARLGPEGHDSHQHNALVSFTR